MEAVQSKLPTSKVQCLDDVSEVKSDVSVKVEVDSDEVMCKGNQRENRLTSIIDQLRCQSKRKGNCDGTGRGSGSHDTLMIASLTTRRDLDAETPVVWPAWCYSGEGGGGGGGRPRRCARNVTASPAHAPPPTPSPAPQAHSVKSERLSPHDSIASRSRSVTPSTSSYPGTPPERGSPHAPAHQLAHPQRYSEMIRTLAARYNRDNTTSNDYYHRIANGFGEIRTPGSPAQNAIQTPLGGLFKKLAKTQGGPPRLPSFPVMVDMSLTKTLSTITRAGRLGRYPRKRIVKRNLPEHSPLDLSAAGESAAKRARLSASPSTRSDSDDRDRVSNGDRGEARGECFCAEAKARLLAWSVDEVCDFVNSIDICAEYASNFREQRIDGAGLPLLTEDHLTGLLGMKLGPALKLRAVLSRRLEPCLNCQAIKSINNTANNLSPPSMAPKMNGSAMKPEPRSNTTSPS